MKNSGVIWLVVGILVILGGYLIWVSNQPADLAATGMTPAAEAVKN